jgi:CheY-like chemotaxis protein
MLFGRLPPEDLELSNGFNFRILVVDDEETIRLTSAKILESKGFEVRTASDGFAALVELRRSPPDILISDLRMPNMGGFELLSIVRRRFPHIPVIAISGEFDGIAPGGIIADYFFSKGSYRPEELFDKIAELIAHTPMRQNIAKPDRAPVWMPRNGDAYFVVTCTDCLRSFSIPADEASTEVRSCPCQFCGVTVCYLADPSSLMPQK